MKSLLLLFLIPLTAFGQHRATTVVQIHPSVSLSIPLTESTVKPLREADYFMSEHKAIVATDTLKIAAVNLYSGQKVDLKHAISSLKKRISTRNRRGTDLIEITANAETPEKAVKMANTVTDAFIKRRTSTIEKQAKGALKALDDELLAQGKLVDDYRKELTKLIQSYGIPYFDGDDSEPLGLTEEKMRKKAKDRLSEFKAMRDQLVVQNKMLGELRGDKLFIYAAGLDLPENMIADYYFKYQEARTQKLALYDQGLDRKHPKIIAIGNRAHKLLRSTQNEAVMLRETLKTKLELVNHQVERMSQMLDHRDQESVDLSLRQQKYTEAKEAYEESRALLREMKIKQQEARVLLKRPHSPVTIHKRAK